MRPEIKQMLLVLQSTHRTTSTPQHLALISLVRQAVHPYMCLVTPAKQKQHPEGKGVCEEVEAGRMKQGNKDEVFFFDAEVKHNESSVSLQQDNEESNSVPWHHSADNIGAEIH